MATQSRRAQQSAAGDATNAVQGAGMAGSAMAADLARQQWAMAADWWAACFRASESMHQARLHMAQRAALLHRQAAENLRKAQNPLELMSVQANLVGYEFQEAMRYMQEMLLAGARAGSEVGAPMEPREEDATANAANAAAQVVGAAMSAAGPMAQAWQQMFTAPLNGATSQQRHH